MGKVIKGYKVFNPDFTCRDMKYEENKLFKYIGEIEMCKSGLHFCEKASDCFNYYNFDAKNIVCEVEARGKTKRHGDGSKVVTNALWVGRRLTWGEVLSAANEGTNNTGHSNSGNWNSGNRNSGDCNSGNCNSGNRNSGDCNSGYRNSGAFCVDTNPTILLFDKQTNIKVREWEQSEAVRIMSRLLKVDTWIEESIMTNEEKAAYPTYKATGGYLKQKTMHEAWKDMWNNLDAKSKKVFTDLPNFDANKFKTITGIEV